MKFTIKTFELVMPLLLFSCGHFYTTPHYHLESKDIHASNEMHACRPYMEKLHLNLSGVTLDFYFNKFDTRTIEDFDVKFTTRIEKGNTFHFKTDKVITDNEWINEKIAPRIREDNSTDIISTTQTRHTFSQIVSGKSEKLSKSMLENLRQIDTFEMTLPEATLNGSTINFTPIKFHKNHFHYILNLCWIS